MVDCYCNLTREWGVARHREASLSPFFQLHKSTATFDLTTRAFFRRVSSFLCRRAETNTFITLRRVKEKDGQLIDFFGKKFILFKQKLIPKKKNNCRMKNWKCNRSYEQRMLTIENLNNRHLCSQPVSKYLDDSSSN